MTTSDTSSTAPSAGGATTSAIISLGKQLAAKLDDHDFLGRWMAMHLAEKLLARERSADVDRDALDSEVEQLILQLWRHRSGAPIDRLPLQALEEVAEAITRIGPDRSPWAFSGRFRQVPAPEETDLAHNYLRREALELDRVARDLVGALVVEAASAAVDAERPWIEEVTAAGLDNVRRVRQFLRLMERPPSSTAEESDLDDFLVDTAAEAPWVEPDPEPDGTRERGLKAERHRLAAQLEALAARLRADSQSADR